jgi:Concanavalin A-like lectin/glucanases superfamily
VAVITHRYHDSRRSPAALIQLDGSLATSGSAGISLSVTGVTQYATCRGYRGFWFDGATSIVAGASAGVRISGALTLQMIVQRNGLGSGSLVSCGVPSSNASADNMLYIAFVGTDGRLGFLSESGAGVSTQTNFGGVTDNQLYHLTFSRSAIGLVKTFVNGIKVGESTLTLPTGGTNGVLRLGAANTVSYNGFMCSVAVIASELSEADVLSDAAYAGFADAPTPTWTSVPVAVQTPTKPLILARSAV